MEKESYETYEYLPASEGTSEAEPYQFFVVQDDGTFLINRQVQYVTQVEANKDSEEGQPCTMLDVTPQQFFVDVDNAGEMTVPEQFNITEGTNNLYTSSYLQQPGTGATIEQIDNNTEEQLKTNIQLDNSTQNKETSGLTEITINDDQYRLLEQKGWILIETNEKVYILDTFGLHDITTNDKLIQKLKADNTADPMEPDPCQFKIEYLPLDGIDAEINSMQTQSEGKLEPTPETECETDLSLIVDESKEEKEQKPQREQNSTNGIQETGIDNLNQGCENWLKDGNVLRIKTDFCLKDIPDKIVLGKTKNGKRLVCRVLKPERNFKQARKTAELPPGIKTAPIQTYQNDIPTCLNEIGDEKLDRIFRMCFEGSSVQFNEEDVKLAERVVKGLLKLPAVKSSIVNRNMLVTKVTVIEQKSLIIESSPTLVTGKVVAFNRVWYFTHKPDLYETAKQELSQPVSENDHNFLHMHLHEIQQDDKFVQLSVTLDTRRLDSSSPRNSEKIFIPDMPLNLISDSGITDKIQRQRGNSETKDTVCKESKGGAPKGAPKARAVKTGGSADVGYACGFCAAIYQSEKDLEEHRATHKTETDEKETEKTREVNTKYGLYQSGILVITDIYTKTKTYACMQCKERFSRLNNCQRHINTHKAPAGNEVSGDKKVYKCKICSSVFHHSATLVKHIMKSHIKVDK